MIRAQYSGPSAARHQPLLPCLTCMPMPGVTGEVEALVLSVQLMARPGGPGLSGVEVTTSKLPLLLGNPTRCSPRGLWDSHGRVLRWSIPALKPGEEVGVGGRPGPPAAGQRRDRLPPKTQVCARALFETEASMLAEVMRELQAKVWADVTIPPGAGGPSLTGSGIECGERGVAVHVAASGKILCRPAVISS